MKRLLILIVAAGLLFNGCSSGSSSSSNSKDIVSMAHVQTIQTDGGPLIIAHLKGSYYDMGYQEGYLLGDKIIYLWDTFMVSIKQDMDIDESGAIELLTSFYSQYNPYIPQEYKDEMKGIVDGAVAAGFLTDTTIKRTYMLNILQSMVSITDAFSCSFFAAWGPRTVNGKLFSSRDLDWNSDTGIAKYKMLAFYEPDGQIPYVTATYTGLISALDGMNMSGVTVSEIGSHNNNMQYTGEPWTLRFRDILSTAGNLEQARKILWDFRDRPNTGGYNWMISYGDPSGNGKKAGAYSVESDSITTSVFGANSDIAKNAVWIDNKGNPVTSAVFTAPTIDNGKPMPATFHYESPSACAVDPACRFFTDTAGSPFTYDVSKDANAVDPDYYVNTVLKPGIHYGLPMSYAVFKDDVALTPQIRQSQTATAGPGNSDFNLNKWGQDDGNPMHSFIGRYWAQYWMIRTYQTGGTYINYKDDWKALNNIPPTKIGLEQAVTIASAVSMHGDIISIAYAPTDLNIAVAYESGRGSEWRPASHNTYYVFNLKNLLINNFTPATTFKPWLN